MRLGELAAMHGLDLPDHLDPDEDLPMDSDAVNHPKHYTSHPSGIEVIEITRHYDFDIGNAIKYIIRSEHKGNREQDLNKALWYLTDYADYCGAYLNSDVITGPGAQKLAAFIMWEERERTMPIELANTLSHIAMGHIVEAEKCLKSYIFATFDS